MFPDKKLELMVNDGCTKGCPAWISHRPERFFCSFRCPLSQNGQGSLLSFVCSGLVYPWNLEYYSAIGINNFKFVARGNLEMRSNYNDLTYLDNYLSALEYGADDMSVDTFFNKMYSEHFSFSNNAKVSEIKSLLPDIHQFIKYGHECAVKCGVECNYCELCAKRTENFLLG